MAMPYEDGTTHNNLNAICYKIATIISYPAVYLDGYIPFIITLLVCFLVTAMLLAYLFSIIELNYFRKNKN
jgi:hypothetical protein